MRMKVILNNLKTSLVRVTLAFVQNLYKPNCLRNAKPATLKLHKFTVGFVQNNQTKIQNSET